MCYGPYVCKVCCCYYCCCCWRRVQPWHPYPCLTYGCGVPRTTLARQQFM